MGWKLLFLIACVDFHPTRAAPCSNQSAVFTSDSPLGTSVLSFVTHSAARITLDYYCYSRDIQFANFYWLKPGQNITTGRYLWRISLIKSVSASKQDYGSDIISSATGFEDGFKLETTIRNVNSSHDNSVFLLEYGGTNFTKKIVNVVCCRSSDILSYLILNGSWTGDNLNCLSTGTATCKSGAMFMKGQNNYFRDNVMVICNAYGLWNDPRVECLSSCPFPPYPHLNVQTRPRKSKRYEVGTRLIMGCSEGRMHSRVSPTQFIANSDITCEASEKWSDDGVSCWAGQVVDFVVNRINLLSGHPTIFTCSAREPLDAALEVEEYRNKKDERVWANITMTPEHNGIEASCKEIDSFNRTVYQRKAYLNVKYMPELTGQVLTLYQFARESTNHVAIRFRANPTLQLSDIEVAINGSLVTNFYLTVDGTDHEAVLHFTKVSIADSGDYTVSLQSHSPVANILTINFTITVTSPISHSPFQSPGNVASVVLGMSLLITIIGVIAGYLKLTRGEMKGSADRKGKEKDIAVVYDSSGDQLNYEDVSDQAKDKPLSTQKDGHADVLGRNGSRNPYVVPMRRALAPPSDEKKQHYENYRDSAWSMDSFDDDAIYDNQ